MLFSSPAFLFLFLPAVFAAYGAAVAFARLTASGRSGGGEPAVWPRNLVLLAASLFFYAWGEGRVVLVMLASIAGNWLFGLGVDRTRGSAASRWLVAGATAFDLGLLVYFKYSNFFVENADRLLERLGAEPVAWTAVALPIGISFFTFQALSYVVDVYRGDAAVQRNPLGFALYIALFPQLVAGPIVRYRDVAERLLQRSERFADVADGARRFVVGLGKKLLIADNVGRVADLAFDLPPSELGVGLAWLGVVCYALQIYFDFSGYSDMAIGLGRIFGFRFLENFQWPYASRSVTEFWRRWHISLSSWFRDYLYVPLGGNRRGRARTLVHLVVVFFLSGLWHGAAWSFVVWGLVHGLFLVIERAGLGRVLPRLPRVVGHAYALLVVVLAWVFFRAETLGAALDYFASLAGLVEGSGAHTVAIAFDARLGLALAAGIIGCVPWLPAVARWRDRLAAPGGSTALSFACEAASALLLSLVFLASAMALSAGTYDPFIYFRF